MVDGSPSPLKLLERISLSQGSFKEKVYPTFGVVLLDLVDPSECLIGFILAVAVDDSMMLPAVTPSLLFAREEHKEV